MISDSCYTIGAAHQVCQDYVVDDGNRVFLSDGCSSSPHTDIGARLLCRQALQNWDDMDRILDRSLGITRDLDLPQESLDATILAVTSEKSLVKLTAFGDGLFAARRRTKETDVWELKYESSAPFYPSYRLNHKRMAVYLNRFGFQPTLTFHRYNREYRLIEQRQASGPLNREQGIHGFIPGPFLVSPVTIELDPNRYDLVMALSDGINTFIKGDGPDRESLSPAFILRELLLIRVFKGDFVKRRVRSFLKTAAQNHWRPEDDFSVGAVYLGD